MKYYIILTWAGREEVDEFDNERAAKYYAAWMQSIGATDVHAYEAYLPLFSVDVESVKRYCHGFQLWTITD